MKLRYDFDLMEMDDSLIAIPVGDTSHLFQGVVKLNKSGGEIFALLKEDTTEDEIVSILLSRHIDIDRNTCMELVNSFIQRLREDNILV